MRLSCNGCRVLRKGCTPDCPIRSSLHWIKSPQSQANATLFLAKFYGRAGLLNLLTSGDPQLRPAIFRSLLYEACGRIVNPVLGSTGLLSNGSWHLCQAAVEAVLRGGPIQRVSFDGSSPKLNPLDIRHVAKSGNTCGYNEALKLRGTRFKRRAGMPKMGIEIGVAELVTARNENENELDDSVSPDSAGSGVSEHRNGFGEADSSSVESVKPPRADDDGQLELELTLGLAWGPMKTSGKISGCDLDTCRD